MKFPNIYKLIETQTEKNKGRNVFYVRRDGEWRGITWEKFFQDGIDFACALKSFALSKGKSVCMLMNNSPEWAIADVGTIFAQGISVGLYPTSSREQCQYIIANADAEFILVDTAERVEKICRIQHELPKLKKIITLDESLSDETKGIISFENFLQRGRDNRERYANALREEAANVAEEDVAIMVYTSGTTGNPKGACLSHRYVINSAESVVQSLGLCDTDSAFSYLPFCHVAERIAGFYTRLYAGMTAYFVDDVAKLYPYMLEVKPTIFASLPRFFEKVHARIMADVELMSATERQQFFKALEIGVEISQLHQKGQLISIDLASQHKHASHLLTSKVKEYIGGNIRLMTSGGAPLPLEISEFFDAAGIPILEAYGLTENVCVAFNRPTHHRFGTVGTPMVGCEIKIAEDGEILVRSRMMFSGYYKVPEKSAEMFRDGWLLTGDLGEFDGDGFLKITGRKKEIIITSTGKNVAPLLLENILKEHPLVSHAMIYGEGKSYLVAMITLNQIELEEIARSRGLVYSSYDELTQGQEIRSLVQHLVDTVNARVSSTEAIKKFFILDHDLSVEADEVTPTMKVKRRIVGERYKDLFENLYL
jgi:long-chain acyl-CoA synthetase